MNSWILYQSSGLLLCHVAIYCVYLCDRVVDRDCGTLLLTNSLLDRPPRASNTPKYSGLPSLFAYRDRQPVHKIVTAFHLLHQRDAMLSGYLRATESEIATSAQFISISLDAAGSKCLSFGRTRRRFPVWSLTFWSLTFEPAVLRQLAFRRAPPTTLHRWVAGISL